ncbi:hypothetical protein BJV74DRAFT_238894 [Russula compacta]|nr:hypothetical protein BJV74DRAFT_238894 [Russula compacta]
MFGRESHSAPIVRNIGRWILMSCVWALGKAITKLPLTLVVSGISLCCPVTWHDEEEGVLILSGGLTVHNLQDRTSCCTSPCSQCRSKPIPRSALLAPTQLQAFQPMQP